MSTLAQLPANAGILICGHGSRAKLAEQEFSLLAAGLKKRFPNVPIEYGFLEYSAPNIHMALDRLRLSGVTKIYALPGMLFAATHAKNDIPSVLTTYQQKYPSVSIEYGQELGLHPQMIEAFQARIQEALNSGEPVQNHHGEAKSGDLYDTMLVVVGRGTSVTEANAEAAKLTRIVCENMGFGWSETVYSGVSYPSVGRGLEMVIKLGFKRIVVAPYFLFGGRLINRINDYVDKVSAEHPDVDIRTAHYLKDQAHVIDTFIHRIHECINGPTPQLTLMESFKQRLARGEVDVHHHHAEFQPEKDETDMEPHEHSHDHSHEHDHSHGNGHSHSHLHSHSHSHSHSHAPYKHIAHPHGPRTMIGENICCCFMSQFSQEVIDEELAAKQLTTDDLVDVHKAGKRSK